MQEGKYCFMTGHSDAPDEILPLVEEAVEQHITAYGVTEFYVGYHGNFDTIAKLALKGAKRRHPQIVVNLALAYHPKNQRHRQLEGIDGLYYPAYALYQVPPRYAIVRMNEHLVRKADYLIVYVANIASNSYKLLGYAQSLAADKRPVITNLADRPPHTGDV